jgi:hypothetical protein
MAEKIDVGEMQFLGFHKVHKKPVTYSFNTSILSLEDCYKRCSDAKWRAWNYCTSFCRDLDGCRLTISGYNTNCFTAEFIFNIRGLWYLARITRNYNHVFPIKNSAQIDVYYRR